MVIKRSVLDKNNLETVLDPKMVSKVYIGLYIRIIKNTFSS